VINPEDVERLAHDASEDLKKERGGQSLFGLVNNAGILIPPACVLDITEQNMKRVMEVNTFGMWRMTKAFFPMLDRASSDKGCIVNVTSVAGLISPPFEGAYNMSKFAAEAFSDTLRRELRSTGIRVAMLEPYFANTPLLSALEKRTETQQGGEFKGLIDTAMEVTRKMRLLSPDTVADCICDSLFSSPCKTRTQVAFWHDRIVIFLLTKVLPDTVIDWILSGLVAYKAKSSANKS